LTLGEAIEAFRGDHVVRATVKADGRLREAWREWLPALEYPFTPW
jgi:hypothetical protein